MNCRGAGDIEQFGAIGIGTCLKCEGTGATLPPVERAEIHRKRTLKHDALMARRKGVGVDTFRAYTAPSLFGIEIFKHPNGCSYSIHEFEAYRAGA